MLATYKCVPLQRSCPSDVMGLADAGSHAPSIYTDAWIFRYGYESCDRHTAETIGDSGREAGQKPCVSWCGSHAPSNVMASQPHGLTARNACFARIVPAQSSMVCFAWVVKLRGLAGYVPAQQVLLLGGLGKRPTAQRVGNWHPARARDPAEGLVGPSPLAGPLTAWVFPATSTQTGARYTRGFLGAIFSTALAARSPVRTGVAWRALRCQSHLRPCSRARLQVQHSLARCCWQQGVLADPVTGGVCEAGEDGQNVAKSALWVSRAVLSAVANPPFGKRAKLACQVVAWGAQIVANRCPSKYPPPTCCAASDV